MLRAVTTTRGAMFHRDCRLMLTRRWGGSSTMEQESSGGVKRLAVVRSFGAQRAFRHHALAPGTHDIFEDVFQAARKLPSRVVGPYLAEVAVITDVVAGPGLVDIGIDLL